VSYLLRMWRESDAGEASDEEDQPTWRASVVSTLTGKRRGFASLDDLFDFLRRQEGTMLDNHLDRDRGAEGHNTLETGATCRQGPRRR
jgi:hypothetical protein